jgi:16S rRNA (uracil1498-N3)-methyltransferase
MPVFFIQSSQARDGVVRLTGPLLSHLRDSLRTAVGEEIRLADEHRRRYRVRVTALDRLALTGVVLEMEEGTAPRVPALIVGQCLLKGERMDWVVQKATELGAAALVPLVSERSVVRPRAGRMDHQRDRWQRIAHEAAQQSERWDLPEIAAPLEASQFFARKPRPELALILSERGPGDPLSALVLPESPQARIALAVGPEGGWAAQELREAIAAGFRPVTLGPQILRAETATLAALVVIRSRLGELG